MLAKRHRRRAQLTNGLADRSKRIARTHTEKKAANNQLSGVPVQSIGDSGSKQNRAEEGKVMSFVECVACESGDFDHRTR